MVEREDKTYENPLDRRNGRVPSWTDVSTQYGLTKLPRGQKKLFQAFYRAQRLFALEKKTKGRRLINALDNCTHFRAFEDENENVLDMIARKVRGEEH